MNVGNLLFKNIFVIKKYRLWDSFVFGTHLSLAFFISPLMDRSPIFIQWANSFLEKSENRLAATLSALKVSNSAGTTLS